MKRGQPLRMVPSSVEPVIADLAIVHQNDDADDGIFDTPLTPTVQSIARDLSWPRVAGKQITGIESAGMTLLRRGDVGRRLETPRDTTRGTGMRATRMEPCRGSRST